VVGELALVEKNRAAEISSRLALLCWDLRNLAWMYLGYTDSVLNQVVALIF